MNRQELHDLIIDLQKNGNQVTVNVYNYDSCTFNESRVVNGNTEAITDKNQNKQLLTE